ncbi:fasciclin domain-containing protein [Neolewinella litorea]|uniref:fasciclin domain-containing protein n=1 Tax=Neolewinella litorea TaxID=2562452 RepID=UPI00145606B8|nr:fasciclin domain-containing protein [Neolewinella litorea]
MKSLFSSLLALLLLLAFTPGSVSAQTMSDESDMTESTEMSDKTIVELAVETQDLSTLVAAVQAAGLAEALGAEGTLTVFAPTNAAFEQLPAGVLDALLKPENKEALVNILKYHVASTQLASTDIVAGIEEAGDTGLSATTMNGDFTVRSEDGNVMIEDAMGNMATVQQADIMASNGVVHLIDRVLVPSNVDVMALVGNGAMGMVRDEQEAMRSDMNDMKEDMTAKKDEMAAEMGEMKEEMHAKKDEMSADMKEMKEDMKATKKEMAAGMQEDRTQDYNSGTTTASNRNMANTASNPNSTIVDVAKNNSNFSTLVSALKSAELVDILSSNGEFTVFAPTNDAFSAVPDSITSNLMQPANQQNLQQVLTYHVLASKVTAADLMKAIEKSKGYFRIQTMGGGSLIASLKDGKVVLTDGNGEFATITDTDIEASNGVIHVIDGVLTPRQ